MTSWGVGDDCLAELPWPTRAAYVREPFATVKAMYSVIRRPKPHFLGPVEPGIQQALAD